MFPKDHEKPPSNAARIAVGIVSAIFTLIFTPIVLFLGSLLVLQREHATEILVALIISLLLLIMFAVTTHRLLIAHKENKRIFNPYVLFLICAALFALSLLALVAIAHQAYVDGPGFLTNGGGRSLSTLILAPLLTGWVTLYSFRKLKKTR